MSQKDNLGEAPAASENRRRSVRRRRILIVILSVATLLMFALLFVQSAFNTLLWLRPKSVSETFSLYVLSTINFLAFVVLLMALVRNIMKLRRERLERQLGARFRTRLVLFFISLSLLPVTFLFFATTGFINRSIDKWFSLPGDEILKSAISIESFTLTAERESLRRLALTLTRLLAAIPAGERPAVLSAEAATHGLLVTRLLDSTGAVLAEPPADEGLRYLRDLIDRETSVLLASQPADAVASRELIDPAGGSILILVATRISGDTSAGWIVLARRLPGDISASLHRIREEEKKYEALKQNKKWYRSTALQTLALITLLVLFLALWLALNLSRGIAEPVRKLAEATARIRGGDLGFRADVVGDDELAALALSFNEMTAELGESRRRLETSAGELQGTNAALLERRQYIEAILQSLSAGVVSLDETGRVTTINAAALALLRLEGAPVTGVELERLLPEEQREDLRRMIRGAARLRSITREVHFTLANQVKVDAAVTVAALHDAGGEVRGAVIVIEDLSELIEAQRRAAWSEVARRMAHEIRNPLTPIRLSAERIARNLLGDHAAPSGCLSERQVQLVRECTTMIGAEVATLQRMVDEFSSFARLPRANLTPTSLNEVVSSALRLYDDRLSGISLSCHFAENLPPVMVDSEQMRQVIVNLIDNALEFLDQAPAEKRLAISTWEVPARATVELSVADTGPGIPIEHRERIFDPYFSTRKRGTGLGLAIVSRIVAEHHGRIRFAENYPCGARFTIELPRGN